MPQLRPSPRFEQLARFDQAWSKGAAPRLEDFATATDSGERRALLEALVQIDLEYRWRLKLGGLKGPASLACLEDYLARHAELAPPSLDLISEEYRVRQRFGDRPGHAEFVRRFNQYAARLPELLGQIDAELAEEYRAAANGAVTSGPALVDALRRFDLLNAEQVGEVGKLAQAGTEPRALGSHLLRRNFLTAYQVNQVLQGHAADLVIGPYLLLERLGEGGAGQVFKARHRTLKRIVALKVIRKELLAEPEAIARFQREIELTSRLDHPNVVRAFNAGEADGTLYLAMEFVAGSDLGRLVKSGGRLPALQACEYIRQAALGLQHAHERGLVHRDIKPHNLMMSLREGQVKLADLGLGRLNRPMNAEITAALSGQRGTGTLTPEGDVGIVGTVDYLAPEQALNFHGADIRADIYSLGCTFYFLLTGQAPFAEGNLAEKLARHMHAAPTPIETVRRDLPPGLSNVLARMLAKKPEERFQTPAELAAALAAITQPGPTRARRASAGLLNLLRAAGRRPALLAGTAVVLLLVLGLTGYLGSKKLEPGSDGNVPANSPALVIECGRGRRIGPGQGIIAGTTQEVIVEPGYGCKQLSGYASDTMFANTAAGRPHCWWDYWNLRFEVRLPSGTKGTLRLLLIDGDAKGRKLKVLINEKEFTTVQDFGPPGKTIDVPISPHDTKDGVIQVRLANLAGTAGNCVISRIEFEPAAPAR